jgi:putative hemolysin
MGTALEILIILLLVLLNGAFAMSELAIVSSRRSRLMAMQKRGVRGADTALALAEDPKRFLPTVQVGITMVGIIAGAFGGARLAGTVAAGLEMLPFPVPFVQEVAFALVVLAITYLSLILGELVPKQLALREPEKIAILWLRARYRCSRASPRRWFGFWVHHLPWYCGFLAPHPVPINPSPKKK